MNKICTSLEQSKKLIELGIDVKTADMIWIEDYLGYDSNGNRKHGEYRLYGDMLIPAYGQDSVLAWSLAALLELMPGVNFYKSGNKIKIENAYRTIRNDISLINAAFEMICWLKENGKI